jgi:hypothetical protein
VKIEAYIFLALTGFFAVVAPVYWLLSRDPAGTTALILTFFLTLMVAGYLALLSRRLDPRPEDKNLGEIAEGAGELGFFPPHSKWPLFVALTFTLVILGPVFGWWLMILGFAFGTWTLTGLIFEFYRGDHAH